MRFRTYIASFCVALAILLAAPSLRAQTSAEGGRESTPGAQVPEKKAQEADENDAYKHSAAVGAFGRMLGMSTERAATVFEVGNFVILAGLVGFFLVKALPKAFRVRTSGIQKHLVDARTATEEASARLGGVEARLAKLDGEIAAMRTQAEADLAREEVRFASALEDEKAKILAAAEQEIAAATTQARRQLQVYAAELAIEQAGRRLVVTAETDRLLVQAFARRLTGDESKGGQN